MKFWKVLSTAALVAGLAPYKVKKDEASGKTTYQALLWRMTTTSGEEEGEKRFNIDLGEGTLTQKLREKAIQKEEAHLFTDDLAVNYHQGEDAEAEDTEAAEAEIEAMAAEAETVTAAAKEVIDKAKAAIAEAEEEIEAMAAEEETSVDPPIEG